jgi:hypothetical protein
LVEAGWRGRGWSKGRSRYVEQALRVICETVRLQLRAEDVVGMLWNELQSAMYVRCARCGRETWASGKTGKARRRRRLPGIGKYVTRYA